MAAVLVLAACVSRRASCISPRTGIVDRAGGLARGPERAGQRRRLYRASTGCCRTSPAIETHLKERLGELFALDYDLLLYDVTSTYFEGLAAGKSARAAGLQSRSSPDCSR